MRCAQVAEGVGVERPAGEGGEASHQVVCGQADLDVQPGGSELRLEAINIPEALEERGGVHALSLLRSSCQGLELERATWDASLTSAQW